jgi:hypothetical protein
MKAYSIDLRERIVEFVGQGNSKEASDAKAVSNLWSIVFEEMRGDNGDK